MRCPSELGPYVKPIMTRALDLIKYDPNYVELDDDEDEDVDMDDEDDDFDDDALVHFPRDVPNRTAIRMTMTTRGRSAVRQPSFSTP